MISLYIWLCFYINVYIILGKALAAAMIRIHLYLGNEYSIEQE